MNPTTSELRDAIDNDASLHRWWKSTNLSHLAFIKQNRDELEFLVRAYGVGPRRPVADLLTLGVAS